MCTIYVVRGFLNDIILYVNCYIHIAANNLCLCLIDITKNQSKQICFIDFSPRPSSVAIKLYDKSVLLTQFSNYYNLSNRFERARWRELPHFRQLH